MHISHGFCAKPSSLLTLICLAVVHRQCPQYLAVSVSGAAAEQGVSAQRLSRLCSGAIGMFEQVLQKLVRRGRPPLGGQDVQDTELAIVTSLLSVARQVLVQVPLRKPAVRQLLVGAYLRLKAELPSLTEKRFCQSLGLAERTLRYWLSGASSSSSAQQGKPLTLPEPAEDKPPRRRPPRRARFGFDLTVPSTQFAADTTDLVAFGIPLKLIASQDIGGRDRELLDSVLVDDHESSLLVGQVLRDTLSKLPGSQLISDQGTAYLAEHTEKLLEQLGAEHAPQREADPWGKATIERAFGVLKTIAAPLLQITNHLAQTAPALARTDLAKAAVTVLLTALLKAYQAGARAYERAGQQRAGLSVEQLQQAAQSSRDDALAEDRSARLTLERIFDAYSLNGSRQAFVRLLRRYPLPVLHEAEKAFGSQVHRNDIRDRKSYFFAIVRNKFEEHKRDQARIRAEREQQRQFDRQLRRSDAEQQRWLQEPAGWLGDALNAFACQWLPEKRQILFGGAGVGHAWIRGAITRLVELHGPASADIAHGVFNHFRRDQQQQLGAEGLQAIELLVEPYFAQIPKLDDKQHCSAEFLSAILRNNGSLPHPQPP